MKALGFMLTVMGAVAMGFGLFSGFSVALCIVGGSTFVAGAVFVSVTEVVDHLVVLRHSRRLAKRTRMGR